MFCVQMRTIYGNDEKMLDNIRKRDYNGYSVGGDDNGILTNPGILGKMEC